ncbi:MAG: sigma-70 family RNA polymerase sigma factor [Clostridiales bacterium]|jgi:RNA polymerase sigma-70 factor (ECF subfamily)|nr:sigma-70 family RNA polymerase sigma factor [Clostridiales bacterium]
MDAQVEIFEAARRGDKEAFGQLILSYEKLIYNVAYRILGNVEDARDAAQDSLLKAYKTIKTCRESRAFKNWLCKITVNTCLDELRKRKVTASESLDAYMDAEDCGLGLQIVDGAPTPEEEALTREQAEHIQNMLNLLPENLKTLIILRDIEGFSYKEVAEITGQLLGTVKSRIFRARAELKGLLAMPFAEQNAGGKRPKK